MATDAGNRGLFCDLAGTLVRMNQNRELPADARGNISIELMPGVVEKLAPMRDSLIFVVSNQAGIARGRFTRDQLEAAIGELDRQLGGILTAWQICPHQDADGCDCRKPKPAMVTELAETYGVDLAASVMIGDQEIDQQCAAAAAVGEFVYAKDFFGWKE